MKNIPWSLISILGVIAMLFGWLAHTVGFTVER